MNKKYEIPESVEIDVRIETTILSATGGVDEMGGGEENEPNP